MAALAQRRRLAFAAVVVKHAAGHQAGRIFALELLDAAVRGIALQAAVVGDDLAGAGMFGQHLRYRPGIAGPDHAAAQAQAPGAVRQVMPDREHAEPLPLVPEAAAHRDELEGVPPVRTAL